MENKKNHKNLNKYNVKINNNSLELVNFYNEKIKKIHIIVFVIVAILFTTVFISSVYRYKSGSNYIAEGTTLASFGSQLRENFLLDAVVILAGITPYFYIPVLGGIESIVVVNDMVLRYAFSESLLITSYIGGLIQMIGIALCIAVGIYYCRLSTKKNKYYHQSEFSFNDLKKQYYSLRKDSKKVEEIEMKKEQKRKEVEACNVKIPYINFIFLGLIAFAIQFVGVVITKI